MTRIVLDLTDDEIAYVEREMESAHASRHLNWGSAVRAKLYDAVVHPDEDPLAPACGIATAMLLGAGIWTTLLAAAMWWLL